MKARLMIAAALAAMTLHAGVPSPSEENTIIVYFENCIAPKDQFAASTLAAHMLAGAGVRLVWRTDKPSDLGLMWERPIVVHFQSNTDSTDHPGALAFARPFEGTRITIFSDRVKMGTPRATQAVLAHVLVHEITHILQGVARHPDSGIMKAHWTAADYNLMVWQPLSFTAGDIDLIQKGLSARRSSNASETVTTRLTAELKHEI